MMSSYRQLKLQDYVANVRTTLHEGRAKEKADKIAARIKEYVYELYIMMIRSTDSNCFYYFKN